MKFFIKTIYLILIVCLFTLNATNSFSRDINIKYSKEEVSNYLSGIISLRQNNTKKSLDYFGKIKFAADKLSGVPISTNLYSFGTNACIEPDSI